MEQSELLAHLIEVLERLKIRYGVTGSIASSSFGEPRYTNDIDVVAELTYAAARPFCAAFPEPDFFCQPTVVLEAIRRRSQFNVLQPSTGLKIDVMIPSGSNYDQDRLGRVVRAEFGGGQECWFLSPEDVIIKKLEFHKIGGSDKHIRDIAGIVKVRGDQLDQKLIAFWVARMGLHEGWTEVLNRTRPRSS